MTTDHWIRIYVANDALEAHVVASALQHAGLDAELRPADRAGFGAALPTLDRAPAVWVRADDADAARQIIQTASEDEDGRLSLADSTGGTLGEPPDDDR